MTLEKQIMKFLGLRWYVKKNPNTFLNNKDIMRRADGIKEVLVKLGEYKPKGEMRIRPLILDNLFGSVQHFLLGYDISSIHHSSKSVKIAILYKIGVLTDEEKRRRSRRSFRGIIEIVRERGDLTSSIAIAAVERVYNRRNLFTHDAILQQTITKVEQEWLRKKLEDANPKLIEATLRVFKKKFDDFHTLPDLSWYVTPRSLESSVTLIETFLENNLGRDLSPILEGEGVGLINRIKALKNIIQSVVNQEYDLIRHSACANINDAYTVLKELYGEELFD